MAIGLGDSGSFDLEIDQAPSTVTVVCTGRTLRLRGGGADARVHGERGRRGSVE